MSVTNIIPIGACASTNATILKTQLNYTLSLTRQHNYELTWLYF